jgi:CRISPR-associated endonuclease/helicase Cas3
VRVRGPADTDPATLRGLEHGRVVATPALLGQPPGDLAVDLRPFDPDGAWTRTARNLVARYGPFLLAYLETVVRMADWRASAGRPCVDPAT